MMSGKPVVPGKVSRIVGNKAIVRVGDRVDVYNLDHYAIQEDLSQVVKKDDSQS